MGSVAPDERTYRVAVSIADELVRRARVPKRLFARLFLGIAALTPTLSQDPNAAIAELAAHLRQRDQVIQTVQNTVSSARRVIPIVVPDEGASRASHGLEAVAPITWWVRKRQPTYRWFATATAANDGISGLVQLNRWHRANVDHEIDRVLLQAFLEDLRHGFRSWWNKDRLTRHVLVLIDDADTGSVGNELAKLRFVADLLAERTQRSERRRHEASDQATLSNSGRAGDHRIHTEEVGDPILVIASSGTCSSNGLDEFPFGRNIIGPSSPDDVDLRPYATHATAPIYVVDLSTNLPPPTPQADTLDRWCRAISGGHRWGFEHLLTVGGGLNSLDELNLDNLISSNVSNEVVTVALKRQTSELRRDLTLLAAIHPLDPKIEDTFERILAYDGVRSGSATRRRTRATEFIARKLWVDPMSGSLHPFFRRLLLTELSNAMSPSEWFEFFDRLADTHDKSSPWHYHYRLAASGNAGGDVVIYLTRRLQQPDAARNWLDDIDYVAAAPRRHNSTTAHNEGNGEGVSAFDSRLKTAEGVSNGDQLQTPERQIVKIVGSLWLSQNYMGAHDLEEYQRIAHALETLADHVSNRPLSRSLVKRADSYRKHYSDQQFYTPLT